MSVLAGRFEQFDGVAIGVFQLNLLAGGTDFHVIPKMESVSLESLDAGRKVGHFEH